jgi:deoxyribonuclease V
MIGILDAAYAQTQASAACVLAQDFTAAAPARACVSRMPAAAAYAPGAFYRRELPLLLHVLREHRVEADILVIDGYVWLDGGRPGLGAHLHEALGAAVIGVAKRPFRGDAWSERVLRGASQVPLYVTAAGLDARQAAAAIQAMHGALRIPTLCRAADRLARATLAPI